MKTYVFSDEHNCDHTYVLAADAQATVEALQARVQDLEQWVQDQSTANLETMRHTDEMQSRAMEAEQQLTQRTAALEAAKADKAKWEEIASLRFAGDHKFVKEMELLKVENANLQAELERVREELADERTAYKALSEQYNRLDLEHSDLRTLIAALPKVEGEVTVRDITALCWASDGTYGSIDCKEQLVSLLQHRQRMEG